MIDTDPRPLCTNLDCPLRLSCDRAWPVDGLHRHIHFEFYINRAGKPECWSFVEVGSVDDEMTEQAA